MSNTVPDKDSFTHDDYIRLITYVVPDRHIHQESEIFKTALDVRNRGFIALHKAIWGSVPLLCSQCADGSNAMRALNCDENGNPIDA